MGWGSGRNPFGQSPFSRTSSADSFARSSQVFPSGSFARGPTWVGFPRDEEVQLDVSRDADGTLVLHFVQQAPPPASDGEGEDRVMVLDLSEPTDASDVEVTFDYPA